MMGWLSRGILPTLLLLACLAVVWEALARALEASSLVLAAPSAILAEAWTHASEIVYSGLSTLVSALAGFTASLVVGTGAAVLMAWGFWSRANRFPRAILLKVVPVVVAAPLITIWSGAGVSGPWGASFLLGVFPVFHCAAIGLSRVDPDLLGMFSFHNASRWQILARLRVPHAVPMVVAGAKVSAGLAVVGSIAWELVAGCAARVPGLGCLIWQSFARSHTELLFACVGASTLLGLGVFLGVESVARLVLARLEDPARRF
ncbi:MAG TPA: ABC transporter permease subunit [Fibrobacteria bacterium]|nr:ABC transporter permease subunit [Fibrobacteria bacterium]HOX50891.1 ABC transporter permease subunit [Fibrobacteria bacterium]